MIIVFKDCGYFNYYHWLIYMLSNLSFYNNEPPSTIYAPLPDHDSFQQQSLRLIFPNAEIINSRYHEPGNIDNIWKVPQCPSSNWRGSGVDHNYYRFLREKLMNFGVKTYDYEYIYISRKLNSQSEGHRNISGRHIYNEDAMMEKLKILGFKMVTVENMSLEKQIGLFKFAKIVISPHGAALVNTCFCTENTHIIEVIPRECDWEQFSDIAKTFNIPYTRFNDVYDWDHEYNMHINIDGIVNLVKLLQNERKTDSSLVGTNSYI